MNLLHSRNPHRAARQLRLLAAAGLAGSLLLAGCRAQKASRPAGDIGRPGEDGVKLANYAGSSGIEMNDDSARLAGVSTVVAGARDVAESVDPVGEVAPTDSGTVQVTSRLPGRITAVYASVGMRVRRGQVLATIDSVDLTQAEATYQTAREHLRLTANQLDQQRKLARYGTLSEPAVEDARRTYAAAEAAVRSDQAQIDIDRVTLENTKRLVAMGEITHKPVEDAQNAYAQAQAAAITARVTLHSATANLDRAKILYSSGVYSRQQLEDADTAHSSAQAAVDQTATQEKLASAELARQQTIYQQDLNGAASLQAAQSKVQQDQHTYQNDVTALGLARTALGRAQVVHKSGIPVSAALQQAQDAYDEARVALQGSAQTLRLYGVTPGTGSAQLANGHVTIPVVAPLDGIVASRSMAVGQITDTATPLAKVLNLDEVYVNAQVYESDLSGVATGSPVRLRVVAYPDVVFQGRVVDIGKEVSPDTRTLTVRTVVRNPGWRLRPGMFATLQIGSRRPAVALAIPEQAIFEEGTGEAVYVQAGSRLYVRRPVRVGPARRGSVPVYSGVSAGDRVVTSGSLFLEGEQKRLESEKRGQG